MAERQPVEVMAAQLAAGDENAYLPEYKKRAARIVAALAEAGYVIVPKEPTEAMIGAAIELETESTEIIDDALCFASMNSPAGDMVPRELPHAEWWRAMIAAAPSPE